MWAVVKQDQENCISVKTYIVHVYHICSPTYVIHFVYIQGKMYKHHSIDLHEGLEHVHW